MQRFKKKLANVPKSAPVSEVARRALRVRLDATRHYLRKATRRRDNVEAVHQLRISIRRSRVALRLFDDLVPRKAGKWFRRKLKAVHQAAGQVRDCDVLLKRLKSLKEPTREHLRTKLEKRRSKAQRKLTRLGKQLLEGKWERNAKRLVKKLRWRAEGDGKDGPLFAPWCRSQLKPLRDEFLALLNRRLLGDEALHELRISGKHLRYALELAVVAVPPKAYRTLYQNLEELHRQLGEVCDRRVSIARFQAWIAAGAGDDRKPLQVELRRERRRLAGSKAHFMRWRSQARRRAIAQTCVRALG